MSMKSNDPKHPQKLEPFGDLFKSVHHFLQERPVKGILQTMDDFFTHAPFQVKVRDSGEKHLITAELPGVKKEQIGIDILGNSLTITINKHEHYTEENDQNRSILHTESQQCSSRTIPFPHPIDERNVKASYQDGLLEISIPKLQGKKINIIE